MCHKLKSISSLSTNTRATGKMINRIKLAKRNGMFTEISALSGLFCGTIDHFCSLERHLKREEKVRSVNVPAVNTAGKNKRHKHKRRHTNSKL